MSFSGHLHAAPEFWSSLAFREQLKLTPLNLVCHECLLPTWIKSCGTFLRLAVEKLDLNNMCRHPALYVQIGADLEVVKWARNDYELKLKRWPQDNVTKNSRVGMENPHGGWHELRRLN